MFRLQRLDPKAPRYVASDATVNTGIRGSHYPDLLDPFDSCSSLLFLFILSLCSVRFFHQYYLRFVLSHLSLNQLHYPEEEKKKMKLLTNNFCRYPYPSNMRVSLFLVGFIASLTYALPKAQEACGQVNPTKLLPESVQATNDHQEASACNTAAKDGQPGACCPSLLSCIPSSANSTVS